MNSNSCNEHERTSSEKAQNHINAILELKFRGDLECVAGNESILFWNFGSSSLSSSPSLSFCCCLPFQLSFLSSLPVKEMERDIAEFYTIKTFRLLFLVIEWNLNANHKTLTKNFNFRPFFDCLFAIPI